MGLFYRLALLALPLASTVVCSEPKKGSRAPNPEPLYSNAQEAFRDLVNALPEESLHAALNSLTPFQDGIFESDRHGVERVHHEDPPLATKLLVAAVLDLKNKRQVAQPTANGTDTTTETSEPSQTPTQTPTDQPSEKPSETPTEKPSETTTPTQKPSDKPSNTPSKTPSNKPSDKPSETPTPSPSSSRTPQPPAVEVPITKTETNSEGETTVISSVILSEPTASAIVTTTRTLSDGKTEVATTTKPAVVQETTDSAGQVRTTTSAVDFVPTKGQVITTTDAKGSTLYTTYTPGGGRVSSVKLVTTTDDQGQQSVITQYTYVEPAAATQTDGQQPTEAQTGRPGFQTGSADKNNVMMGAAALGGILAMFI